MIKKISAHARKSIIKPRYMNFLYFVKRHLFRCSMKLILIKNKIINKLFKQRILSVYSDRAYVRRVLCAKHCHRLMSMTGTKHLYNRDSKNKTRRTHQHARFSMRTSMFIFSFPQKYCSTSWTRKNSCHNKTANIFLPCPLGRQVIRQGVGIHRSARMLTAVRVRLIWLNCGPQACLKVLLISSGQELIYDSRSEFICIPRAESNVGNH